MYGRASNSGSATDSNSSTQQLDFVIGVTNMTWPGIAAVEGGFANLTAAGMRTTNVLNSQMNLLGAGMMAAGGTAALALGLMTAEAAKFEKQMAVVQALIQKTGQSSSSMASTMQGLSAVAKELSMKYGVSLSEITSSMESLGRAGLTTAGQMTSVLEPALQLSKIEGITTDVASDEIIKMVNLFGGTYERDAAPLATILAHAANISTTSATDIYNALKYSGGVASSIWGSQDQDQIYQNAKNITAMIATLSQQGVTGALAGTSIRSFFQYVTNPTAKSKKALTAVGLNNESLLTTNSAGETVAKDPMEIFNTLNTAFKANKMSDLQVLQWFQNWGQGKMGQQYVKLFPGGTESPLLASYVKQMNEQYSMQERVNTIMSSAT
ncbi:MAG: phage tail tape measure protein [Porphyromonadaceae bacterium]|nr:phage tail tape measure protein [Porphyromonadaceae bacterium]